MTKYKAKLRGDFLQRLAEIEQTSFDFYAETVMAMEMLFADEPYEVVPVQEERTNGNSNQ